MDGQSTYWDKYETYEIEFIKLSCNPLTGIKQEDTTFVNIWISKGAKKKMKKKKERRIQLRKWKQISSAALIVAQSRFLFILLHQSSSPFKYKSQCDYDTWQYRACEPLANN